MKKIYLLALAFCLPACEFLGVSDDTTTVLLDDASQAADSTATPSESAATTSETNDDTITIDTVTLNAETLTLDLGQVGQLKLDVTLTNDSHYRGVATSLTTPYGLQTEVKWFSNNADVVTVSDSGKLTAVGYGSTTVKASVYNKSALATITVAEETRELIGLAFTQTYSQTSSEAPQTLSLSATFAEGILYSNLSAADLAALTGKTVTFASSDLAIATIDESGTFTPLANGATVFTASCGDFTATLALTVKGFATDTAGLSAEESAPDETLIIATEEPDDITDRFLNDNDTLTLVIGEDGGFGSTNFPDIAYGAPNASRTNVVSLGLGGEVTIELGGFVIVDGAGPDFTVFENAFTGWAEPAYVSVSADGVTYHTFPCDPWDDAGLYAGCAGVTEVTYSSLESDYWDATLSGGDSFDLADLGLESASFVKITDADACPNPVVCVADKAGFDLDAVAIVNGVNQE